jgi:hypothetical protein
MTTTSSTTSTATTANLARALGLTDDDLALFLDVDLAAVQAIPSAPAPAPADVADELVEAARRFALAAVVRRQGWRVFDRARAELASVIDAGGEGAAA